MVEISRILPLITETNHQAEVRKNRIVTASLVIVPHIFPIQILNGKRQQLIDAFKAHDIQYGIQYRPNHTLTYFKSDYDLPVTDEVFSRIISIPMHPELTDDDITLICSLINNI